MLDLHSHALWGRSLGPCVADYVVWEKGQRDGFESSDIVNKGAI